MAERVVDASAVLAFLLSEPGTEVVAPVLPTAMMSAVNFSEVIAVLIDRGDTEADAFAKASLLALEVAAFDQELAIRAGSLRPITRRLGLSLGDRACLALAEREGLPILTADRIWATLDIGVEIRLIR